MKKFFRNNLTAILVCLVALFLAAIISLYIWGVGYLVAVANEALNNQVGSAPAPQFNLEAAVKLDYRGALLQQP